MYISFLRSKSFIMGLHLVRHLLYSCFWFTERKIKIIIGTMVSKKNKYLISLHVYLSSYCVPILSLLFFTGIKQTLYQIKLLWRPIYHTTNRRLQSIINFFGLVFEVSHPHNLSYFKRKSSLIVTVRTNEKWVPYFIFRSFVPPKFW